MVRALKGRGYNRLLLRTHHELDLTDQAAVGEFFQKERPKAVIMAAARVGGIQANDTRPAEFIRDNLLIQDNVIDAAYRAGVAKFVFLGSSCIYPKLAPQPIKEDSLLTGPLEPTNEWYAIAKIAGLKMCQAYRRQYGFNAISLMPTNLYGPGDNFDLQNSHVLPALIRRFHEAKLRGDPSLTVWGTGTPRREFLHVDDLADAAIHLLNTYDDESIVNIGWGEDVTIRELAEVVASVTGFRGRLEFYSSKPDGTPRKLLDTSRLTALGWVPKIKLKAGIASTYAWYKDHAAEARLIA
jgi:GDP-L-fucose synthase